MSKKEEKVSRKFLFINIILCCILFALAVIGIIQFSNRKPDVIEKEEKGGSVTLNYTSASNSYSIVNVKKMSDSNGEKITGDENCYDFSVDVNLNESLNLEYEIALVKNVKNSNISDDDIRIYLEKEESGTYTRVFGPDSFKGLTKKTLIGSPSESMVIAKVKKVSTSEDHYRLRMWLSESSKLEEGNYSVELQINAISK